MKYLARKMMMCVGVWYVLALGSRVSRGYGMYVVGPHLHILVQVLQLFITRALASADKQDIHLDELASFLDLHSTQYNQQVLSSKFSFQNFPSSSSSSVGHYRTYIINASTAIGSGKSIRMMNISVRQQFRAARREAKLLHRRLKANYHIEQSQSN